MEQDLYEFIGNWEGVQHYLTGYAPKRDEAVVVDIKYLDKDIYGVKITPVTGQKRTDHPYVEPFK